MVPRAATRWFLAVLRARPCHGVDPLADAIDALSGNRRYDPTIRKPLQRSGIVMLRLGGMTTTGGA